MGQTFQFDASIGAAFKQVPDLEGDPLRRAISAADGPFRYLEEFINRYVVTAENDDGDITFDSAGVYTFQGDVAVEGSVTTTAAAGKFRTAASGQRFEMSGDTTASTVIGGSTDYAGIDMFSGNGNETLAALLGIGGTGTSARTVLTGPNLGGGQAYLGLGGATTGSASETRLHSPGRTYLTAGGTYLDMLQTGAIALYSSGGTGFGLTFSNSVATILEADDTELAVRSGKITFGAAGANDYIEWESDSGTSPDGDGMRFVINGQEAVKVVREASNFTGLTFGETNDGLLYDRVNEYFYWITQSAERMRLQNDGTGLATGASNRSLSVEADGAVEFYRRTSAAGDGALAIYSDHGSTGDLQWLVYADGDTASDTGVYTTISDRRTKRFIRPLTGSSEWLRSFGPVRFQKHLKFKHEDDSVLEWRDHPIHDLGYIAQDVPAEVQRIHAGIYSVAEHRIVPFLHGGWIEHDLEIIDIKARLAAAGL